jgi:hypothetical protein
MGKALEFKSCRFCAAVLLSAVCATALAQQAVPESRDAQARKAVQLWLDSCVTHFTRPEGVREFAVKNNFPEARNQKEMLQGRPGTVWIAPGGPGTIYFLSLQGNGGCQVVGRLAASQVVNDAFTKLMEGIKEPNVTVKKLEDQIIEVKSVRVKRLSYSVYREGSPGGWTFQSETSDSEAAPAQVSLSVFPSAKP